jgi:hypothetical protein
MSRNEAAGRPRLSRIAAGNLFFEINPQNLPLMVDDLLIYLALVKVKICPGFMRYD